MKDYQLEYIQSKVKQLIDTIESNKIEHLHFVRHAKTSHNVNRIVQGYDSLNVCIDFDSIDNKIFSSTSSKIFEKYDSIYCSPAIRAIQTASIFSVFNIEIVSQLNEISWGCIDGKSMMNGNEYININEAWFDDQSKMKNMNVRVDKGESLYEFALRIILCMKDIIRRAKVTNSKNILIFGHGLWVNVLISLLNNLTPFDLNKRVMNLELVDLLHFIK